MTINIMFRQGCRRKDLEKEKINHGIIIYSIDSRHAPKPFVPAKYSLPDGKDSNPFVHRT
ncbi:hypothetical protein PITCH_A330010 [uncultured Desulfobacterium sp.]|uniref:Uncharacterized protein n=1 Tax=uncultured Desulfobacterium sp. TaxID=201089 RepID=A0A445MZ53_9BACT|nr:hypothetical protein PITCH_A330010 [uncultured Desulfobacterium sp.]